MIALNKWVLSLGTLAIFILLSFVVIYILNKAINFTTRKVSLDNRIIKSLRTPIRLIIVLVGVFIASYYLKPDFKIAGFNIIVIYKIIIVFVVIYTLASVIRAFFVWYVDNLKINKKISVDNTIFQFLSKAIIIVLWIIAVLVALGLLGIEIKPILAGLGIAGLAVALALQDTLSNFFSAVYIAVDQPVKIGDYIEVAGSTEKGYVREIEEEMA